MNVPTYLETSRFVAEVPSMDHLGDWADLESQPELLAIQGSDWNERREPGEGRLGFGTTLRMKS